MRRLLFTLLLLSAGLANVGCGETPATTPDSAQPNEKEQLKAKVQPGDEKDQLKTKVKGVVKN